MLSVPTSISAPRTGTRQIVWTTTIAADFFLLSNPLVVIHRFSASLTIAVLLTLAAGVWDLRSRHRFTPWPVAAFLAFCLISILWSIDRGSTVRAFLLYFLIAALSAIVVIRAETVWIANGIAVGGVLVVLVSIVTSPPEILSGVISGEAMPGVGTNRNILAYTIALALPGLPRMRLGRPTTTALVAGLILVGGLVLARSTTGILTALAVLGITAVFLLLSRLPWGTSITRRRVTWATIVLVGLVALLNFERIAAAFARSSETLSGRAPFWMATIRASVDSAWLGYGWGAVWMHPWQIAPGNHVADRIYSEAGLVLTHGHNSLFDLLPQIGIVGTALYVVIVASVALRARAVRLESRNGDERQDAVFVVLMLIALAVFGFSEPLSTIPLGWWCTVLIAGIASGFSRRPHQVVEAAHVTTTAD